MGENVAAECCFSSFVFFRVILTYRNTVNKSMNEKGLFLSRHDESTVGDLYAIAVRQSLEQQRYYAFLNCTFSFARKG